MMEGLWSDSGELLKKHPVCADHVSFRCLGGVAEDESPVVMS